MPAGAEYIKKRQTERPWCFKTVQNPPSLFTPLSTTGWQCVSAVARSPPVKRSSALAEPSLFSHNGIIMKAADAIWMYFALTPYNPPPPTPTRSEGGRKMPVLISLLMCNHFPKSASTLKQMPPPCLDCPPPPHILLSKWSIQVRPLKV